MKKFILLVAISFVTLKLEAQCTTQFAKIIKFGDVAKKDDYGNVTGSDFICSLANGQQKEIPKMSFQPYTGETGEIKLLYSGLNSQKTVLFFVYSIYEAKYYYNEYAGEYQYSDDKYLDRFEVNAISFNKQPNEKKFDYRSLSWDPAISYERKGGYSENPKGRFYREDGWNFSKVEADNIVMTRNGAEHKFAIAKTQRKDCGLYFKKL